jgi:hypothetical protein
MITDLLHADPLTRRSFAEALAKTALGVTLLPYAAQAAASKKDSPSENTTLPGFGKAKAVIWLQMIGGMSHIDSFDPKTGDTKGPKDPITTKAGYQLGGVFTSLARDNSDQIAIIRSMSSKTGVHAAGQYVMRTGYEQRGTIKHPTIGAFAQKMLGPSHKTLPSSVCVGRNPDHGNGFFPAAYSPLPIHDPEAGLQYAHSEGTETIEKRLALLNQLDDGFRNKFQDINVKAYTDFYDNTMQLLTSADLNAFKITDEPDAIRAKYGSKSKLGQGCLLARRLVEHNVRFVEVAFGGWDMHNDIDDGMEDKGGALDSALSALLSDLKSKGMLETTLVCVCSEFGRTPKINARSGRDHYPKVFSTVLAGGGIKGGTIYGSSDKDGKEVADKQTTIMDFHATIGHALGLDVEKQVTAPSGRPFTIANKGSVVSELFG